MGTLNGGVYSARASKRVYNFVHEIDRPLTFACSWKLRLEGPNVFALRSRSTLASMTCGDVRASVASGRVWIRNQRTPDSRSGVSQSIMKCVVRCLCVCGRVPRYHLYSLDCMVSSCSNGRCARCGPWAASEGARGGERSIVACHHRIGRWVVGCAAPQHLHGQERNCERWPRSGQDAASQVSGIAAGAPLWSD